MLRILATVGLAGLGAGAAIGSPYVPLTEEHLNPGVIEIEVAPDELARCRLTVEQVLTSSPAPGAALPPSGGAVQAAVADAYVGPQVVCVSRAATS